MTILDDAMRKHIEHIVCTENRPFSYIDFLTFEVVQQHYNMSHGTFRNKISAMLKREEVEVAYYSKQAFYTMKGIKFVSMMIPDHTGGTLSSLSSICSPRELRCIKNHPVYRVIQNIPFDNSALHDIRLRTTVTAIWHLLSRISSLYMDDNSKDILVIKEEINHLNIRVTVHHSDTISDPDVYDQTGYDNSGPNHQDTNVQIQNSKDVCEEIKSCLQEEIAQRTVSKRDRLCIGCIGFLNSWAAILINSSCIVS